MTERPEGQLNCCMIMVETIICDKKCCVWIL